MIMESLKTKKGSPIKRYKDVGKKMGNDLYIHKDYIDEYVDPDFIQKRINYLPVGVKFTIIKINRKDKYISFIYSPDFDTADEPIVSDAYKVKNDGAVTLTREKKVPQIYHHKWLFVKDDYIGFSVAKSKERSKKWLSVSDKINMAKIGSKRYWEDVVLPLLESDDDIYDYDDVWDYPRQEYSSKNTSLNQVPMPIPHLLRINKLKDRSVNLDIGGGKYENTTILLAKWGLKNYVFDPFNRTNEHNSYVIEKVRDGQVDSVTIMNVLNVISEKKNQIHILKQAKNALKDGGKVFVYSNYKTAGKKAGPSGNDSWQHHKHLNEYLSLVKEIFPNAIKISNPMCIVGIK